MFEPGMDPMLIGHLEGIASGSTDHLCLEGIRGDFVLLGWTTTQAAYDHLARLGIFATPGILPPSILPPSIQSPMASASYPTPGSANFSTGISLPPDEQQKRRLYYIDLRSGYQEGLDGDRYILGLKELLKDRQTKTVSLKLNSREKTEPTPNSPSLPQGPSVSSTPRPVKITPTAAPTKNGLSSNSEVQPIPSRSEAHASVSTNSTEDSSDPQWKNLDQLLDDFDSLDI
jgi:hypothetical protein